MLMLMRSDEGAGVDCEDPVVALACLDPELDAYKECPAACRDNGEEDNEDDVVKSGDIVVSISEGDGYVISKWATSYLDTIDFDASEDITVNSITLERFGYSTTASVNQVWLEDADGNEITNRKSMSSSKDSVTLNIKKDYNNFGKEAHVTIGMTTAGGSAEDLGKSIGFKVVDMESSAKNVDLPTKDANLYDIIDYDGSDVTVEFKGSNKEYNVKAGELYEVAKLRVRASNAAIELNGIVLTNDTNKYTSTTTNKSRDRVKTTFSTLDLGDFVDDVEVYADGKKVDAKYSIKRDELNLSFSEAVEVAINKAVDLSVKVSLKDFDDYGDGIRFILAEDSDLKAVESKTKAVIHIAAWDGKLVGKEYVFEGGKISLDSTKLSSPVKGAQWAEDVVFGKGNVTVWEEIIFDVEITPVFAAAFNWVAKDEKSIIGTKNAISDISLFVGKTEYSASYSNGVYTIKGVELDKDSELRFVADVEDNEAFNGAEIKFNINGTNLFKMAGVKYQSNNNSAEDNVVWNISLYNVKVEVADGDLRNDLTSKTIQFKAWEGTVSKNIFEGTYKVSEKDVTLKSVALVYKSQEWPVDATSKTDATYNVYIDDTLVATLETKDILASTSTDSVIKNAATDLSKDIEISADKSVKVVVEAKVNADQTKDVNKTNQYSLYIFGEDENGVEAWTDKRETAKLKIVWNEDMTISTLSSMKKQDLVLTDSYQSLAKFVVKPVNGAATADLDSLEFTITDPAAGADKLAKGDFELYINNDLVKADFAYDTNVLKVTNINKEATKNGLTVELKSSKELVAGEYKTEIAKINDVVKGGDNTFTRLALPAIVRVVSQKQDGNRTNFVFDIQIDDDQNTSYISNLELGNDTHALANWAKDIDAWTDETYSVGWYSSDQKVTYIAYTLGATKYVITKAGVTPVVVTDPATRFDNYKDIFTVLNGTEDVQVYASNANGATAPNMDSLYNYAVTSVTLDKSTLSLTVWGADGLLTATVNPDNATDKTVTWTSSDDSKATVTNGTVHAVAAGTVTITATAGGKSATCTVTVSAS